MVREQRLFFILILFLSVAAACGELPSANSKPSGSSSSEDSSRLKTLNTPLYLSGGEEDASRAKLEFIHLATAQAPQADDKSSLQATHFAIQKWVAYVAYMSAGEKSAGAIDVINLKDPRELSISKTLYFEDEEFADLKIYGNYLIAVGAHGARKDQDAGAVLKVFDLGKDAFSPRPVSEIELDGHFATSLLIDSQSAFVTSGADAGVYEIDLSRLPDLEIKNYAPLYEATFIGKHKSERLVLAGSRGGARIYSDRGAEEPFRALVGLEGLFSLEAPLQFVSYLNYVVTNPAEGGLQIYGSFVKSEDEDDDEDEDDSSKSSRPLSLELISKTELKGRGNGLAMDDNYAYLAQGDAGLQVFNLKKTEKPQFMGAFDFAEDPGSANAVGFDSECGMIFMADGRGGFRVLQKKE